MICKFAGFFVDVSPIYDYTKFMVEKFRFNGSIPKDAEIISVGKNYTEQTYKDYLQVYPQLTIEEAEHIYLSGDLFRKIIDFGAIILHSSAIKYGDKCYLFSAPTGTGKSTHTSLWEKLYGNKVRIINDDKPILKYKKGKIIAYGTPFAGGTHKFFDENGEVDAIIFIERSAENSIKEITAKEAIPLIFQETVKKLGADRMNIVLDMIEKICKNVRLFKLYCNMEESSAVLAHNTLIKDDINEG